MSGAGAGATGLRRFVPRLRWMHGWNWWPINRPHVKADWWDDGVWAVWIDWGNGNSDPVWTLGVEVTLPWLTRKEADA